MSIYLSLDLALAQVRRLILDLEMLAAMERESGRLGGDGAGVLLLTVPLL